MNNLLAGFPSPRLQAALDAVLGSDGLIAVTPIFSASYSGLFKLFFDLVERDGLAGKPVLIAATGGTARHSLALEHAIRPLFAYLNAAVVATAVYAATEDWGGGGVSADGSLVERIDRAAQELALAMAARDRAARPDPFEIPGSLRPAPAVVGPAVPDPGRTSCGRRGRSPSSGTWPATSSSSRGSSSPSTRSTRASCREARARPRSRGSSPPGPRTAG